MSSKPRFVGEHELVKLSEIAKIKAGNVAPKKDAFTEDGIPFVRAGSLTNLLAGGSLADLEKIDGGTAQKLRLTLFPAGTVVFAKSGMSCMTGNVYVLPKPCYVVSHLACVTPNGNYASYLKHYFRFNRPNRLIENPSFPSIKLSKIQGIELRLPSPEEGVRQVQALERIESQIEQVKALLTHLDSLAKSRFVEMFSGVDQTRPLEKLIVPKTRISYGIVQPGPEGTGDMGILRPVDIVDGRLCLKGIKRIDRKIGDSYRRTELTGNEILTVVRGATGQTVRSEANCIGMNVTRGIAVIRYDPSLIDPDYLVGYMNSDDGQRYIADHTQGATLQQINIADLKAMPIPAPSLKSQQQFAAFFAQVDKSRFVRDHEMNFRWERFTLSWSTIA